jgi:broad specificity phosphatase PhoE
VTVDLRSFGGTANFWFIRHGESEANRDGIIQGRQPSRLTETGKGQAREAGEWLRGQAIELVLSSPLTRASETARIIAEVTGTGAVETAEELTEIDTGIFSGLSFAQAQRAHPQAWTAFQRESWEGVPGAERIEQLLARADAAWARLAGLARDGKRSLLCVTHSGFLQWIVRSTLGCRTWMPLLSGTGNCNVSHLRVTNTRQDDGSVGHLATWLMINSSIH